MVKKITLLVALTALLTLVSQMAIAASDKTSNGDNNGKPFQELNDLISENRSLIEVNQGAIADLQAEVDAINKKIIAIENELSAVSSQVDENTVDITDAFARISAAEEDILGLRADLDKLTEQLTNQFAAKDALDALKNRMDLYHDPCLWAIDAGQTVTGELVDDGECVAYFHTDRAAQYYQFTLASKKLVTIEMKGSDLWGCGDFGTLPDPAVWLHVGGRDVPPTYYSDSGDCGYNSKLIWELDAGTYTIQATSYNSAPDETGTFTLSLSVQ